MSDIYIGIDDKGGTTVVGGGGTTSDLRWGPAFGQPGEAWNVGVHQFLLDTLGLESTEIVGTHYVIDLWELEYGNSLHAAGHVYTEDLGFTYDKWFEGSHYSVDSLALESTETVGASATVDAWDAVYNQLVCGATYFFTDFGFIYDKWVLGASYFVDALGLESTQSVGASFINDTNAVENTENIGQHYSIDAIGVDTQWISGQHYTTDVIDIDYQTVWNNGARFINDANGVETNQTAGQHLSGTALGAPFFQELRTSHSTGSVASISLSTDADTEVGDLLVAFACAHGPAAANTITPDEAGWTNIRTTASGAALSIRLRSDYRIADTAGVVSYTYSLGTNANAFLLIARFKGFDTTNPINVSSINGASAADPVGTAITTTTTNCYILGCAGQAGTLDQSYTPPAGYAELVEGSCGTPVAINEETVSKIQAAAASTGSLTFNSDQIASTNYVAIVLAVAPGEIILAA